MSADRIDDVLAVMQEAIDEAYHHHSPMLAARLEKARAAIAALPAPGSAVVSAPVRRYWMGSSAFHDGGSCVEPEEDADGEWVRYEDHIAALGTPIASPSWQPIASAPEGRCQKCHGTLEVLVDASQPWSASAYALCPDCHPLAGSHVAPPNRNPSAPCAWTFCWDGVRLFNDSPSRRTAFDRVVIEWVERGPDGVAWHKHIPLSDWPEWAVEFRPGGAP